MVTDPSVAPDGAGPFWRWVRRAVLAGVLCVMGSLIALALSAAFAPSASASPLPSRLPAALGVSRALSDLAPAGEAPHATALPAVGPVVSRAAEALDRHAPVLPAPVRHVGDELTTAVGPVAAAALDAVRNAAPSGATTASSPATRTPAPTPASALPDAASGTSRAAARRAVGAPPSPAPGAPRPRRAPRPLRDPVPSAPTGAAIDSSSSGHGSGPLDALPPSALLLPVLVMAGVVLGRGKEHPLLSFPRFVPPG